MKKKKQTNKALYLSAAIVETILGFPVLGGLIVVGLMWIPMVLALSLHIFILCIKKDDVKSLPQILGILANTIGLIPGVGMVLHILAAVFNYKVDLAK